MGNPLQAKRICPECGDGSDIRSRRDFLRACAALAAGAGLGGLAFAEPSSASADSFVGELYRSLTDDQRKALCFGLDHPLRRKAEANWAITEPEIDDLEPVQQDLVEKIVRSLTSEEGFEKFMTQMGDDHGGLGSYHIALFGTPGDAKAPCEFVLTGRHVTMRADANNGDGVAFGGPMVYGHAASGFDEKADHPGNVFWYQAKRANEVFAALNPEQRKKAQAGQAPTESSIEHRSSGYAGLRVGEMTGDQKELVKEVMRDLLNPYRAQDADEVMRVIAANGGLDQIHLAFYALGADGKNADIGKDGVWDVWRLEGPGFVWHFRGAPHVHTWVNIAKTEAIARS